MTAPAHDATDHGPDLRWQHRRVLLIGLSAAAGWLDALAFLHLGKVFVSFMSGNLRFVGIGAGNRDGAVVVRAGAVLAAFVLGTAIGARLTGSRLVPGTKSPLGRMLLVEQGVLGCFAVLWLVAPDPGHATTALALLGLAAAAMGLQAAIALAFHLPNVATVAMTATLAQLGALAGWRAREGEPIVAKTPAASLMIPLCLSYLISAGVVAALPGSAAPAFGPVVLLAATALIERRRDEGRRRPAHGAAEATRADPASA